MKELNGIEDCFFKLLQIGVGQTLYDKLKISDKEWLCIYILATEQGLVSVVFNALEELNSKGLKPPMTILYDWIGYTEQIKQINAQSDQFCQELTSYFENAGYNSCVLKGQGVAKLYPKPDARQPGDIDIWVDAERDEIVRLMRNDGIDVTYVDYVNCHAAFFEDVEVEVHFRPTWMFNPFVNRKMQRWIRENKDVQMSHFDDKVGFCYPIIGFNLVFSLVHIYRHILLEGIGLRQLTDYYYILNHSTQQERDTAFSTLGSFGLAKFVGAVMYVLRRVFDIEEKLLLCQPNDIEGDFLLSEILRGGNFGKYDDRNVCVSDDKKIRRGLNNLKRNLRFVQSYPSEVFWAPAWKVWHWCWRKWKGYL